MDQGCSSGDGEKGSQPRYILKAELTWIPVRLNIRYVILMLGGKIWLGILISVIPAKVCSYTKTRNAFLVY